MGYQTQFDLEVITDTNHILGVDVETSITKLIEFAETDDDFGAIKDILSGDDNCFKWYSHEQDMRKFSAHFPGVLFKLSGKGEEDDDYWHEYHLDGKSQHCKAVVTVTYPEFNPEELK